MYEENIALFLCEIAYLYSPIMTEEYTAHLNNFIHMEYLENKNTFDVLFVSTLLKELFEEGYQPLPFSYIEEIQSRYCNLEKYIELIEKNGPENGEIINNLVLKFLHYMEVIATLYCYEPIGYGRILS